MSKTVKTDKKGEIALAEFSDLINIKRVHFYSIEELTGGVLKLVFYDKKKKIIKPKKKKKKKV